MAASIPDPRTQRGVRYPASAIVAASIAAVLAGARSFAAISEWLDDLSGPAAARIGFTGRSRPWESTIRRLFDSLDGDVIDTAMGTYLAARTKGAAGRQVIALDCKTVRGARTDNRVAPHLVAVFDHATGTVLGQAKVADKITSANAREAHQAVLADWILGHWGIENRLHWVRDVTFDVDRSQIRTGSSPRVMASMRNLAVSTHRLAGATNIAKATRHHARNPERPLTALLPS